jgi:hypothetical protein
MVDQVNFAAAAELAQLTAAGVATDRAWIALHNADSRPPAATLPALAAVLGREPQARVVQQSATFTANLAPAGGRRVGWVATGAGVVQSRWTLVREIPRLRRQAADPAGSVVGALRRAWPVPARGPVHRARRAAHPDGERGSCAGVPAQRGRNADHAGASARRRRDAVFGSRTGPPTPAVVLLLPRLPALPAADRRRPPGHPVVAVVARGPGTGAGRGLGRPVTGPRRRLDAPAAVPPTRPGAPRRRGGRLLLRGRPARGDRPQAARSSTGPPPRSRPCGAPRRGARRRRRADLGRAWPTPPTDPDHRGLRDEWTSTAGADSRARSGSPARSSGVPGSHSHPRAWAYAAAAAAAPPRAHRPRAWCPALGVRGDGSPMRWASASAIRRVTARQVKPQRVTSTPSSSRRRAWSRDAWLRLARCPFKVVRPPGAGAGAEPAGSASSTGSSFMP